MKQLKKYKPVYKKYAKNNVKMVINKSGKYVLFEDIEIYLPSVLNGKTETVICPECNGSGSKIIHNKFQVRCDICNGLGKKYLNIE